MRGIRIIVSCLMCCGCAICIIHAGETAKIAETVNLYSGAADDLPARVWGMKVAKNNGELRLNADYTAKPWAGIVFRKRKPAKNEKNTKESLLDTPPGGNDGAILTITPEWVKYGFVRYRFQKQADAYGNVVMPCGFQCRLDGVAEKPQNI